ncbi:hypothetical protein [Mucilaginibacter panaciglaebae]|uniref:hypothetical protein n=1 Tax=Mucilaginibacter panaciglaebae TaxID=502331 RepID=UPI0031F0960D
MDNTNWDDLDYMDLSVGQQISGTWETSCTTEDGAGSDTQVINISSDQNTPVPGADAGNISNGAGAFLNIGFTNNTGGSSTVASSSDGSSTGGSSSGSSSSGGAAYNPFSRRFWTAAPILGGGNYAVNGTYTPPAPPPPAVTAAQVENAITLLGNSITESEKTWLRQNQPYSWAADIVNYVTNMPNPLTDKQKYQLQTHIDLMNAQNQAYITVVNNYGRYHGAQVAVNPTIVTSYMWWDNIDWVDYSLLNPNEQNTEAFLSTFQIAVIDMSFLDRLNYPKLAKIVDGLYQRVKSDLDLQAALVKYSNLPIDQVLAYLKPGKGPKIVLKDYTGDAIEEQYGDEDAGTIYINRKYAEHLNVKIPYQPDPNFEFFIMAVILHEFVHFGNQEVMQRFPTNPYNWDAGAQFEDAAFGGHVDYDLTTGKMTFVKTH